MISSFLFVVNLLFVFTVIFVIFIQLYLCKIVDIFYLSSFFYLLVTHGFISKRFSIFFILCFLRGESRKIVNSFYEKYSSKCIVFHYKKRRAAAKLPESTKYSICLIRQMTVSVVSQQFAASLHCASSRELL